LNCRRPERKIASVNDFDILKRVKALFATAIMLVSAVSIWAQGQIVEGVDDQRIIKTPDSIEIQTIPSEFLNVSLSTLLLPITPLISVAPALAEVSGTLTESSGVEINARTINLTDVNFGNEVISPQFTIGEVSFNAGVLLNGGLPQPQVSLQGIEIYRGNIENGNLSPAPLSGSLSDFQPSSTLSIQSVPEPSTFALGSLAFGLIALARLNRRQQILKR
jgi:hypothetical protein